MNMNDFYKQAYNDGLDTAIRLARDTLSDIEDAQVLLCGLEASKYTIQDVKHNPLFCNTFGSGWIGNNQLAENWFKDAPNISFNPVDLQ